MSRKSKIDAVKKVEIVEKYLNGELSQKGAAKMCGVNKRSVQDWIRIYKTDGPESLLSPKTNKRYSKELKLQAVHAYLSGEGSLDEICVRFGIRQHPQLSSWIKAYNEGKELKELTGGSAMKKARKTTLKERICIVKDCLDHDRNYGSMALKYDCSYQQIRNWVTGMKKWEVPVWRIGEAGGSVLSQAALQKKNYGTVSQSWNVKIKTYRWRMTC